MSEKKTFLIVNAIPNMEAVFEFPNPQAIKDMILGEEFNALNDLRIKAYKQEVDLMICETL